MHDLEMLSYWCDALLSLFQNHVHELEAIVGHGWICENHKWHHHFNFTVKKKEGNGNSTTDNLFFAEVSHMQGEEGWHVNCCRMIKCEENGISYLLP